MLFSLPTQLLLAGLQMLTPNFGDQWGPKITNNLELGDWAHFKLHTWQDEQTQQQPPVLDTLMDLNGVCAVLSPITKDQ